MEVSATHKDRGGSDTQAMVEAVYNVELPVTAQLAGFQFHIPVPSACMAPSLPLHIIHQLPARHTNNI